MRLVEARFLHPGPTVESCHRCRGRRRRMTDRVQPLCVVGIYYDNNHSDRTTVTAVVLYSTVYVPCPDSRTHDKRSSVSLTPHAAWSPAFRFGRMHSAQVYQRHPIANGTSSVGNGKCFVPDHESALPSSARLPSRNPSMALDECFSPVVIPALAMLQEPATRSSPTKAWFCLLPWMAGFYGTTVD